MIDDKKRKIIVAHPFQQHSFKTAQAVKKAGMLYKYATTVYNKKGSLTNLGIKFITGTDKQRALKRSCKELSNDEVVQFCELGSLILLLLQRIDKSKKIYTWLYKKQIKRFNKALFNYIKKNPVDAVIVYDVLSADLIERLKQADIDIKIILDMSAPYYNYMEREYRNDAEKHPVVANYMLRVLDSDLYSYRRGYSKYEVSNADAFLVASDFTKKSLSEEKVVDNVFKCEYGIDDFVDLALPASYSRKINKDSKINVIYVGAVNQQKGAYQIFRIIPKLKENSFVFNFYGNVDMDSEIVKSQPKNCCFHGHVPRAEMLNAYRNSDVLIFPSLSDGFGFVVPEALSNGVAVIASSNAGAGQLIRDGYNGYVFNVGDDDALIEILNGLRDNVNLLNEMKNNAFSSIRHLTWDNYNTQVKSALEVVFKEHGNTK